MRMTPIDGCVNLLEIGDVGFCDLESVSAWMFACDMNTCERRDGCKELMSIGRYSFSNIEHRVTVRMTR